jgi:hypothetical protein
MKSQLQEEQDILQSEKGGKVVKNAVTKGSSL